MANNLSKILSPAQLKKIRQAGVQHEKVNPPSGFKLIPDPKEGTK